MALLTIGLNHATAPLVIREQVAFASAETTSEALADLSVRLGPLAPETALLSTCNRTELYCTTSDPGQTRNALVDWLVSNRDIASRQLDSHLYALPGQEAVRHAFRVASGLDSMVIGEPQILGQMKEAARIAQDNRSLGSNLHRLFQRAFSVAKAVRTHTAIGTESVSLAAASVRLGRRIFEDLADCSVLFVGAGEMIELCATHWAGQTGSMTLANRTVERASRIAHRFGAQPMQLADLPNHLASFDVVISCTASSLPIIGLGLVERAVRQRRHRPMLMIDLAVPRDIEAEVGRLDDVYLYTVDDLGEVVQSGIEGRRAAMAQAESIIDTQVHQFMNWIRSRQSVPIMQQLQERGDALRRAEVERARRLLARGDDPSQVLEALSVALTNKFLHGSRHVIQTHGGNDREQAELLSRILPEPRR